MAIVQLPGRDSRLREPLLHSVTEAADALRSAIERVPPCPTVLLGHGLGALLAFETARRLQQTPSPPLALVASGCAGPRGPRRLTPIAHLPDDELVAEARRRYGWDVISDNPEAAALALPSLRADHAMLESYHYEAGAPLDCPIIACGGAADRTAAPEEIEGWRAETRGRFTARVFAGGHLYPYQERAAITAAVGNQLSVILGARARSAAAI